MIKLETTGLVGSLTALLAVRYRQEEDVSDSLVVYDAGDGDYAIGWHTLGGNCEWKKGDMLLSVIKHDAREYIDEILRAVNVMTRIDGTQLEREVHWTRLMTVKRHVDSITVVAGNVNLGKIHYSYVSPTGVK